jgi:lysozyme
METSQNGIDFIKSHEGLRLTQYLDQAGLPTIGYGHLIKPNEGFYLGKTITTEQAEELLRSDLRPAEIAINSGIFTQLTQWQYDALVSLVFNIGGGAFNSSTLKGRINNEFTKAEIEEAWLRWNKVRINGVLTVSNGLTKRRQDEADMYFSIISPEVKKKV